MPFRLAATEVDDGGEPAGIVHAYLPETTLTLCGLSLSADVIVVVGWRWAERPLTLPACPVCLEQVEKLGGSVK